MMNSSNRSRDKVLHLVVYALLAVAVVSTGTRVATTLRRFRHEPTAPTGTEVNWRQYTEGQRLGRSAAPLTAVVFTDYECTACSQLGVILRKLRREYPAVLTEVVRQYPLPSHPLAEQAARAALCADSSFDRVHDALIETRPVNGQVSWQGLARAALGADSTRLEACMAAPETTKRLRRDMADGERLRVSITPTILLNSERYDGLPADFEAVVRSRIHAIQRGR